MNWEDEDYAKVYTRDTPTWLMLPWQGRALLPLLIRKCDGAGIIDTGSRELEALALTVMLPREVVEVGLAALIECGTVARIPGGLELPNYIAAQSARKTEATKKRGQRSRHRDLRRAQSRESAEAPVPTPSHAVPTASPFSSSSANPHPQPQPDPQLSSSSSSADPGKAKKRRKTEQAELPAEVVPPKSRPEPQLVHRVHAYFVEARTARLEDLHLELTPDEPPSWARSAATVKAWGEVIGEDDEGYVELRAKMIIDAYLKDPYWADAKRREKGKDTDEPQPYPWNALLAEKIWRKYHEQLERELDGTPAAGGVH